MATHRYDNGGQEDGTLDVSIEAFYGDEYVCLDLVNGDSGAHLTADQAEELAADLIAHAQALRRSG